MVRMTTFRDLGLNEALLSALDQAGFETPTPIQDRAIPVALQGSDVLGIAQTGTGKTAAFMLPALQRLAQGRARARMPRMLILEPTRELAAQVAESFEVLAKETKLTMALLIGGVSFGDQERLLDRGVDVLVATPGRLLDHFERGKVMLNGVQTLVVDEADRMLDLGFIPDLERIFSLTPPTRQTLFFSATMPPEIQKLTDRFLSGAERIEVARPATTAETVTQHLVKLGAADDRVKRAALRHLLRTCDGDLTNAIIFCNRKRDVDVVAKSLKKHGFDCCPIHGDLPQSVRTQNLEKFRAGEYRVLVASDVAARGLDIPSVSHVFNFDVPYHPDDYVHRIGRTGRAGRSGAAYMLSVNSDAKWLDNLHKLIGKDIPELAIDLEVRPSIVEPEGGSDTRRRRGGERRNGRDGGSRRIGPERDLPDLSKDGWGDHIPGFLQIATPLPARAATKKAAET